MSFSFSSLRAKVPGGIMTLWATIAILIHIPAISILVQELLTLTLGHTVSTGLLFRTFPANLILTFAIVKRYRLRSRAVFNPTFVAWMFSMLLQIEWLTSYCQDDSNGWNRVINFAQLVSQTAVMLWACLDAASHTLPIPERQNHVWSEYNPTEQRKIQPVYFVSSPAFGPKWLVPALYRAQDRVVFALYGAALWVNECVIRPLIRKATMVIGNGLRGLDDSDDESYPRTKPSLQGREHAEALEKTRIMLTIATLLFIHLAMIGEPFWVSVPGFLLYMRPRHRNVWNITELICHYALEVDGEYFELSRVGDSIKLSRKPVPKGHYCYGPYSNNQEPERIRLSRTFVGYTFLTKDEIEEKGRHIITISPSYDALNFNCQGVRNNLFEKIFDDRATSLKRMNFGWVSANAFLIQTMAQLVLIHRYNLDMDATIVNIATSKTIWGKATATLPLLWIGFAVLILINTISGIVSCVSTAEGKRFRFRMTIPRLLAPIFILRALPVITRKLSILLPVKQVLCLLLGLRYTLMTMHAINVLFRRKELLDTSFTIVQGNELEPTDSAPPADVNNNDFAFDPLGQQWISRYVLVQKVKRVICEEERERKCWSWEIEKWEERLLIISGIALLY